jgi:hypothetical protein
MPVALQNAYFEQLAADFDVRGEDDRWAVVPPPTWKGWIRVCSALGLPNETISQLHGFVTGLSQLNASVKAKHQPSRKQQAQLEVLRQNLASSALAVRHMVAVTLMTETTTVSKSR